MCCSKCHNSILGSSKIIPFLLKLKNKKKSKSNLKIIIINEKKSQLDKNRLRRVSNAWTKLEFWTKTESLIVLHNAKKIMQIQYQIKWLLDESL